MPQRASGPDWRSAVGVLPIDVVLAEEHDRLHGDQVRARLDRIPPTFDERQLLDLAGIRRTLLDPSSDGVAAFLLSDVGTGGAALRAALAADDPTPLATAFVDRLNALLGRGLAEMPSFQPLVAAGAVDALGEPGSDEEAVAAADRLLLEAAFPSLLARQRDRRLAVLYESVRRTETAALCLSGGGIRSATFALGVLRGLARHDLLGRFDYLSTVSGGGYIGSWLRTWMHHDGAAAVRAELRRPARETLEPEAEPIRHLRAFSHYLTPRIGLLSADTWTLAATVVRNLVLNWLVLLPLIAAVLLVPRLFVAVLNVDWGDLPPVAQRYAGAVLSTAVVVGGALGTLALAFVHEHHAGTPTRAGDARGDGAGSQRAFVVWCLVPLVLSVMILSGVWYVWWDWHSADDLWRSAAGPGREGMLHLFGSIRGGVKTSGSVIDPASDASSVVEIIRHHPGATKAFLIGGVAMHVAGWMGAVARHRWRTGEAARGARYTVFGDAVSGVAAAASGAVVAVAALCLATWFIAAPQTTARDTLYATLGPPAFLAIILVGSQLFVGLTSRTSGRAEREWAARFNAWLLIVILGWTGVSAVVLYGPALLDVAWQRVAAAGIGGVSALVTVALGRSTSTDAGSEGGAPKGDLRRRLLLAAAAPLFALSVIVALSATNERLIRLGCAVPQPAVRVVMRCRYPEPDSAEVRRDAPLRVLSHVLTDSVVDDRLVGRFQVVGTDSSLAEAVKQFRRELVDSLALPSPIAIERAPAIAEHLRALLARVSREVDTTHLIDASFRDVSRHFTHLVLRADSVAMRAGPADPELSADFDRRDTAQFRADTLLSRRLERRDTLMMTMYEAGRVIDSVVHANEVLRNSPGVDSLAEAVRARVRERLDSVLSLEPVVLADSARRAQSRLRVDAVRRAGGAFTPADAAVPTTILVLLAALSGFGWLMGRCIDTNEFSLHGMYHSRLVRAYLGASRPSGDRRPNPFTGFDPHDDVPMQALWPSATTTEPDAAIDPDRARPNAGRPRRAETRPPLHVVNVSLNLVAGRNLAWQQRKAESMTVTPLHAGSAFTGYRRTSPATRTTSAGVMPRLYGGPDGITLGTAVTISGAAASPNAGYNSSPVVTFLMTLLNARLGWWLGNPGRAGAERYHLPAPRQRIMPILAEMFGMTSDRSHYVYLSDGGHFENLGLYEMVLRRCRLIVVSDAGADPTCAFEDLGNAVRKIRVDLGVRIDFPAGIDIGARGTERGAHWAVGRIHYADVDLDGDGDADDYDGVLVYLKPAVYGGEPRDVYNYAQTSAAFPHESTTDQFFSESQFESYRALGEYVVDQCIAGSQGALGASLDPARRTALLDAWRQLADAERAGVPAYTPMESGEAARSAP